MAEKNNNKNKDFNFSSQILPNRADIDFDKINQEIWPLLDSTTIGTKITKGIFMEGENSIWDMIGSKVMSPKLQKYCPDSSKIPQILLTAYPNGGAIPFANAFAYWYEQNKEGGNHTSWFSQFCGGDNQTGFMMFKVYQKISNKKPYEKELSALRAYVEKNSEEGYTYRLRSNMSELAIGIVAFLVFDFLDQNEWENLDSAFENMFTDKLFG